MLSQEVGFALNNGHRQASLSGPKSAHKQTCSGSGPPAIFLPTLVASQCSRH
jgi:hypothetical protein